MMGAAMALASVASGKFLLANPNILVSLKNKPTENIHGFLLIPEAGGKVTDFNGNPWSWENCESLVYSNGLVHEEVLRIGGGVGD